MSKVRYEEMLPSEIRAARTACPIVYVPLGTLEWHGEHDAVGKWETSLLMALRPECVDMGKLPSDPDEPLVGVSNDARRASEEYGRRGVELVVQRIVAKAKGVLPR
jgi:creatinine amidohydrolase/Fe(II)-dependent formamide hydrolase-like protein